MDFNDFLSYLVKEEHRAIEQLLDKISEEELKAEIAQGETIGDRFAHMCKAEFSMAKYLVPEDTPSFEVSDNHSRSALKQSFEKSLEQHLKTIRAIKPEDLDKEWVSERTGNRYTYKFLLYHFLEHLATHRGQIAMRLRQIRKNA